MSVDILMATYNGGRHLRNQLLSLQQQTYKNMALKSFCKFPPMRFMAP